MPTCTSLYYENFHGSLYGSITSLYAPTSLYAQTSLYDVTTTLYDVDDFARRRITLTPFRELLYTCLDYRTYYELISKYNVGLKTLLSEGLSEPEFYGDLVYKLKKLKGITDFSLQFGKIISRYRRIGYNLNVMRQSACLVFNPIMVDNYAAFFNCTPVGRASDSMMAPT